MFTYDGRQIKSVGFGAAVSDGYYTSSLSDLSWLNNSAVVSNLTPGSAYLLVPWLYRAVNWRANQISRMPFLFEVSGHEADETDSAYASIFRNFKRRLWMIESQ